MKPNAVTKGYKRIARQCDMPDIRFHDLRHTHASLLLAAGIPIHVVQARMGHTSIQTTVDVYGHLMPTSDIEAGNKLDIIVGKMSAEQNNA